MDELLEIMLVLRQFVARRPDPDAAPAGACHRLDQPAAVAGFGRRPANPRSTPALRPQDFGQTRRVADPPECRAVVPPKRTFTGPRIDEARPVFQAAGIRP